MDWREHIWIDPERMHGTPCMRGTRVPVYVILDNLAAGESAATILDEYPTLRPEHISAALAFAAELAHERVVPIPAQGVRFKLDENMPRLARERLESRGWDVHDVHQEGLASALDQPIQEACEREERILVTLDTDFADTRRYNPGRSPGVIVLRPRDQSIRAVLECLDGAIRALATQRIRATLWIVEPERLRIRDHPTGT